MKPHPRLSRAAADLVIRFETYHPLAQPAAGGGWTVGYGHTRSTRQGAQVSREDAEALLLYDLTHAAEAVEAALFAPVTQRQFEALSAFCFNIGIENFRLSSALARVNAGSDLEAADEIERWRRAALGSGPQVVDALVRRRAAEKAHFLGLPEGFSKTPRAVLRPLPDTDATGGEGAAGAPPTAASATLHAANSVQARLRALVPEPEPPPFAPELQTPPPPASSAIEEGEAATSSEPALPREPPAMTPEPTALRPLASAPAPYVAPPPPPPLLPVPQPDVAANDGGPPDPPLKIAPSSLVAAAPVPDASSRPPSIGLSRALTRLAAGLAAIGRLGLSARGRWFLITTLGAALLAGALVVMLGGRPGLADLGAAALGVLIMIPGIYGLLGPQPPRE